MGDIAEPLPYSKPFNLSSWFRDIKDEDWERREEPPKVPLLPLGSRKKNTLPTEFRFETLTQAALALTESKDLTGYANDLAGYLGVSREQLYSMPLAEFIERYESAQLTEEINSVYDEELEQEDEEFLAHVKSYQGRVLNYVDDD